MAAKYIVANWKSYKTLAEADGITVTATTSDTTMLVATCVRKMEIWSCSPKMIGRKTAALVRVPAATARPSRSSAAWCSSP